MVTPEQTQIGDKTRGTRFREVPGGVSGPDLCTRGAQTSDCLCGSERRLTRNEDRQHFVCATWLHKAHEMPKEKFKREVEKELTVRESSRPVPRLRFHPRDLVGRHGRCCLGNRAHTLFIRKEQ
jgi:hypothetical protein